MITRDAAWELGFGEDEEFVIGDDSFGEMTGPVYWVDKENKQDFAAINGYITSLPPKADVLLAQGKISQSKWNKFGELYQEWKKFNQTVWNSWYVSDADLNLAKKKRDDINMVLMPTETKAAQRYSSQAAGMSQKEFEGLQDEGKTFLQRNWLLITGLVIGTGAAVYLASAFMGYRTIAAKAGIFKALSH